MPIFEIGPHFIERAGAFLASQVGLWCMTTAESEANADSPCDRLFLHCRAAVVCADARSAATAWGYRDAAESPHRGLPRSHRRPAWLRLFCRNAGRNPRRAGDHSARRPHQGLRGVCGARGRFSDPHAGLALAMGLAQLSRAHRLRVRRPLRGHRGVDQRQGDQRQSRRALRALPNRKLRRFRERAIGSQAAWSRRFFRFRGRRRDARTRYRADGDDQRRSTRPAAKRASPPHLARTHGACRVFRSAAPPARRTAPCSRSDRFSPLGSA